MVGGQSWGFDAGSNLVNLELQILRDTTGSDWTTASVGFRRITDNTAQASLWFYQSRIGINTSGPVRTLSVAGTFSARPNYNTTPGQAAHWKVASGSDYELWRYTSSKEYKRDIDYDVDFLADYELRPATFYGIGEEDRDVQSIAFIAQDIAAQDDRLAVYAEDELVMYSEPGVMAILAAKANRAEAEIKALEERVRVLESA